MSGWRRGAGRRLHPSHRVPAAACLAGGGTLLRQGAVRPCTRPATPVDVLNGDLEAVESAGLQGVAGRAGWWAPSARRGTHTASGRAGRRLLAGAWLWRSAQAGRGGVYAQGHAGGRAAGCRAQQAVSGRFKRRGVGCWREGLTSGSCTSFMKRAPRFSFTMPSEAAKKASTCREINGCTDLRGWVGVAGRLQRRAAWGAWTAGDRALLPPTAALAGPFWVGEKGWGCAHHEAC